MKIYIDTETGTFGEVDSLVIMDATPEQLEDLQGRPDSYIINVGMEHGTSLRALVRASGETGLRP